MAAPQTPALSFREVLGLAETRARLLGFYAVFCCTALFLGGSAFAIKRFGGWGSWYLDALVAGLLIFGLPLLVYTLARRSRARSWFSDLRFWLLTPLGAAGLVLELLSGDPGRRPTDLGVVAVALAGCGVCMWAYALSEKRRLAVRAIAERKRWNLTEKEAADVGWEDYLLKEMTPRERALHYTVLCASMGIFIVCFAALAGAGRMVFVAGLVVSYFALLIYFYSLIGRQFIGRRRSQAELEVARQMQMSLMPSQDPRMEGFEIAGTCLPAEEVGGDFYSYFESASGPGPVGIAVGDVSGKGMKAAIATVLVSGMLRSEHLRSGAPGEILRNLNLSLKRVLAPYAFVAMQVVVVDPRERRVLIANAGQIPPLLLRGGQVSYLRSDSLPLGIAEELECPEIEVRLQRDDLLVLFTDGITEATSETREIFGFERVEEALGAAQRDQSAMQVADLLLGRVRAFVGGARQHDDITLVVIKVK